MWATSVWEEHTREEVQVMTVYFPHFVEGELEWPPVTRREPMVLSYLLPLSRRHGASLQTPVDWKAFLPSQCHTTTRPKSTKPVTVFSYTPLTN